MQSGKRNMERIAEVVPESDEQRYQHFLLVSAWNERAVLDQVAREANRPSGGTAESALILDESGILKSGTKSVGVGRQYIGQLGKVDNCQTGVYAMHSLGERTALVDEWLYLLASWTADPDRYAVLGEQVPKSKTELALEMVLH